MNGVLCIYKPTGFTSFDVIAKLRGILRIRRLGHAGTLDPMATGVLPVFVGPATRACDILPNQDKTYLAEFALGMTTTTQDSTGEVTSRSPLPVTREALEAVLPDFCGDLQQIPPMYSAVSVNGRRLYDLARQGIEVERKPRAVTVTALELRSYDPESRTGTLYIACSKGTYVRTLLHDIGAALGCGGVMTALERQASCGITLADCVNFADVERARDAGRLPELLLPIERMFAPLPRIDLDAAQTAKYRNGVKLPLAELHAEPLPRYAVFGTTGFLGTGRTEDDRLRVEKNLTESPAL